MLGLKERFLIEGLNQDVFLDWCKKRDIYLFDVKKVGRKRMYLSVNSNQSEIFFANAKELCYNVKKVGFSGKALPLYYLAVNFGLVIGFAIFLLSALFLNDLVFKIDVSGSGKIYEKEVLNYLSNRGIGVYSRFSSFSIEGLEDDILRENEHLTFVGLKKSGNVLSIYTVLKTDEVERLNGNVNCMTAEANGEVVDIKVYRGTAVVSEGDLVYEGDLLVDGYVTIKESVVKTNVLASVTLKEKSVYTYLSKSPNDEETAKVIAQELLGDKEIVGCEVQLSTLANGDYEYLVQTEYLCTYTVG